VPGSLIPLLEATYEDIPGAKAALSAWARNSQLQIGGTFKVALSTLRPRMKKRGHRTYAHCNVRGCPFKIELEEGPDGRFGALNANLSLSATGHHARVTRYPISISRIAHNPMILYNAVHSPYQMGTFALCPFS